MQDDEDREFQLRWLDSHPPRPKEAGDAAAAPRRRRRRRIRGKPAAAPEPVDGEIDLHGCALDEALAAVEAYVETRHAQPFRLRVIHGRSSSSPHSIRDRLRRNCDTVWKHRLAAFYPEPYNSGAAILVIRPG